MLYVYIHIFDVFGEKFLDGELNKAQTRSSFGLLASRSAWHTSDWFFSPPTIFGPILTSDHRLLHDTRLLSFFFFFYEVC
jgi:hypothetical protein